MVSKINIIFVRHGQSTQNIAKLDSLGMPKDYNKNNIRLTNLGKDQAKQTGKYIKETYGEFDTIFVSPVKRCMETANILVKYIKDVSIKEDSDLYEIGELNHDLFDLKDSEREKLIENTKVTKLQNLMDSTDNRFEKHKLSKKLNKEATLYFNIKPSPKETAKRYARFLNKIKKKELKYGQVIVICHKGSIEGFMKIICGMDIYNQIIFDDIKNCSIICAQYDFSKDWFQLISMPNSSHLKGTN